MRGLQVNHLFSWNNFVQKLICRLTNHQLFTEKVIKPLERTPEIGNHKCILVHQRDPFSQLGPFKIEVAYHNPSIVIIHELFTEEDTDYLVDFATPRLSRTRQIKHGEDDGWRPKNEWMYRKTVKSITNNSNLHGMS